MKKQLLNLATGELAAAIVFIFVYHSFSPGRASFLAFSYLIFILLQGSLYWFYRYLLIRKQKDGHSLVKQLLKVLQRLNSLLLLGVAISIPITQTGLKDFIVAIVIFLFGMIEYINYYWYRLSYGQSGFNIKILWKTGLAKSSINKFISK